MTSDAEIGSQRHSLMLRRLAIAGGLLGCVAIGLVFPFPMEGRLWGELFDLAHAPVFCGTLLLIVGLCDPTAIGLSKRHAILLPMTAGRVLIVAGVLITAGAVAELLQALVGRSASISDVAANAVGLVAGLFWVLRCRSTPITTGRKYTFAAAALLLSVSVSPLLDAWDCLLQIRSFPMLASFERPREFRNWKAHSATLTQSQAWATEGKHCARLQLEAGNYPGMLMTWFERDWSNHSHIHLDLKNLEGFDLQLVLKLHDHQHVANDYADDDRFHEMILVPANAHISVSIPLSSIQDAPAARKMDLDQMWTIDLFAVQLKKPASLLVDALRLEP